MVYFNTVVMISKEAKETSVICYVVTFVWVLFFIWLFLSCFLLFSSPSYIYTLAFFPGDSLILQVSRSFFPPGHIFLTLLTFLRSWTQDKHLQIQILFYALQ